MGVYIREMEFPRNCAECEIIRWDGEDYVCPFSGISAINVGRQNTCPLVEVPKGGREVFSETCPECGTEITMKFKCLEVIK